MTEVDVLIAGGGPVGLFLACELAGFGVACTVVERGAEGDGEGVSAVRGVSERSLATLGLRGLRAPVSAASRKTLAEIAGRPPVRHGTAADLKPPGGRTEEFGDWRLQAAMKGHFGVIPLFDHDGEFPDLAIVPVAYGLLLRVLREAARRRGATLRHGRAVTGVRQDADGCAVTLDDGGTVRARYVVGADGGRSAVRRAAGFDFPGTDPTMIARGGELVTLADPLRLPGGITRTDRGVLLVGLIPGQIQVLEYGTPSADWGEPPPPPPTPPPPRRRVGGTDVAVTGIEVPIRYTDNARQAADYRRGRVLLAGDAAHVHSPFGAQGLNLGLQDAANLGWRLAWTLRGLAPGTAALDAYTAERHPVAARVLRNSRAQAALIRPDVRVDALRAVFGEVIDFPDVRRYFIRMVNGADVRYTVPCAHPLAGGFLPDTALTTVREGTPGRTHDLLTDHRMVLLDLADSPALRERVRDASDRVRVVTAKCPDLPDVAAVLVRPDGYVIWAAESEDETPPLPEEHLQWIGGHTAEVVV